MKVDVGLPLTALCGKELTDQTGAVVTLKKIMFEALVGDYSRFEAITPKEKLSRYELAKRIFQCGSSDNLVELSREELLLINSLAGLLYPPMIVGRFNEEIESILTDLKVGG